MSRRSPQRILSLDTMQLPLEPITVRIPVAVQLTGIKAFNQEEDMD